MAPAPAAACRRGYEIVATSRLIIIGLVRPASSTAVQVVNLVGFRPGPALAVREQGRGGAEVVLVLLEVSGHAAIEQVGFLVLARRVESEDGRHLGQGIELKLAG